MFGFFRSKSLDAKQIADAIHGVATDRDLLSECISHFAITETEIKRVPLALALFCYYIASSWVARQKNAILARQCEDALNVLLSFDGDPTRKVNVSEYLISPLEIAELPQFLALYSNHAIDLPAKLSAEPSSFSEKRMTLIKSYQLPRIELLRAIAVMRIKRFSHTASGAPDDMVRLMCYGHVFMEQVSGLTVFDIQQMEAQESTKRQMMSLQ